MIVGSKLLKSYLDKLPIILKLTNEHLTRTLIKTVNYLKVNVYSNSFNQMNSDKFLVRSSYHSFLCSK